MLGRAAKAQARGGTSAALRYLSGYRHPARTMSKGPAGFKFLEAKANRAVSPGGLHNISRGVRRSLGGTAYSLHTLSSGLAGKSLTGRGLQFFSNVGRLGQEQLRGATYKTVSSSRLQDGVLKGKGFLGKFKHFSRKPVGYTAAGEAVIKKRKLIRPLSWAMTAPGFAGMAAAQSTNPDGTRRSSSRRLLAGAGEYALWGVSPALGMGALTHQLLKRKEKEKQQNFSSRTMY